MTIQFAPEKVPKLYLVEADMCSSYVRAELQRVVVGSLQLQRLNALVYWSSSIQVHPSYRGQAIAGRMHVRAVEHVREKGGAIIVACVRDDNIAMHRAMGKTSGWLLTQRINPETCLWIYHVTRT